MTTRSRRPLRRSRIAPGASSPTVTGGGTVRWERIDRNHYQCRRPWLHVARLFGRHWSWGKGRNPYAWTILEAGTEFPSARAAMKAAAAYAKRASRSPMEGRGQTQKKGSK